jgi:hypothetical protein
MSRRPPPEGDLMPPHIARLVSQSRIERAHACHDESVRALDLVVDQMKADLEAECRARYDEKRREVLERLYGQFAELLHGASLEVEMFAATLPPAKQAHLATLRTRALRAAERAPRAPPPSAAREDIRAVLAELEGEQDFPSLVVFSDHSLLCAGRVFNVGDAVQIETRITGDLAQATVAAVTSEEVEVLFRDNTLIALAKADVVAGRVVLAPWSA